MAELLRPVARRFPPIETLEGAGVRLRRSFGQREVPLLDPFLLLDHFGSENPADYMAGFPWHPHRGIETVTYMLEGRAGALRGPDRGPDRRGGRRPAGTGGSPRGPDGGVRSQTLPFTPGPGRYRPGIPISSLRGQPLDGRTLARAAGP